jgi:peptidylprolyl isomerase
VRRRIALLSAVPVSLALLLGSCASESDTPSAAEQSAAASSSAVTIAPAVEEPKLGVSVTGAAGQKPQVTIATPLSVTQTTRKIITKGTGATITADDTVQFAYTLYAGNTGAELDTSYGGTNARFQLTQVTKGIARGMVGAHVGDRIAVAIAPEDGFGAAASKFGEQYGEKTTFVLVADLISVQPKMASGAAVTPPANLPKVTLNAKGVPTGFTVSDPAPPADTVAQPLIKGNGPIVQSGQTVTMQYVGATLADGKVFQSSWDSQTFSTVIGAGKVIPGWDKGIVGQTVGSRVLLVIPAAQAYGDEPANGAPSGALVFAVDILDAY